MPNESGLYKIFPLYSKRTRNVINDHSVNWEEFIYLPFMEPELDETGVVYFDKDQAVIIRNTWFKSNSGTKFLLFKPVDEKINDLAETIFKYSGKFSHNLIKFKKKFNRNQPFRSLNDCVEWANLLYNKLDTKYTVMPEFNRVEWKQYNDHILVKELIK